MPLEISLVGKYCSENPRCLLSLARVSVPFKLGGAPGSFIREFLVSVPPAELMSKILPTLSQGSRAALFNLSYVKLPPNLSEDDTDYDSQVALAITQTNGISAGARGVGVFPNVSRLNHACARAFNAVYSWREKEQKLVVYAIRPIKEGQELLTAYFDTRRPRNERRLVREDEHALTFMDRKR